jgi:hypothetical protein
MRRRLTHGDAVALGMPEDRCGYPKTAADARRPLRMPEDRWGRPKIVGDTEMLGMPEGMRHRDGSNGCYLYMITYRALESRLSRLQYHNQSLPHY